MDAGWQPVLQWLAGGVLAWRPWQIVAYTVVTTHLTIVAVTVYLHRCQAHRALDLHPAASHAFRFWLWIATGMATREWVAVHRKHHACCAPEGDPHSPQLFGIGKVLLQDTELYRAQARDAGVVRRFGQGSPASGMWRRGRRRAGRLLWRDPEYMCAAQRSELAALRGRHGALTSAIAMRADLCQLWQGRHIGPREALARLRTYG